MDRENVENGDEVRQDDRDKVLTSNQKQEILEDSDETNDADGLQVALDSDSVEQRS